MQKYDPSKIEKKWQDKWEADGSFTTRDDSPKEKKYLLIEFPYPSGDGLHVGHIRSWTAMDVVARKLRAQGKNVLYPIGWDAFGLPAENYAIKTGVHPKQTTKQNTDNFRRQIKNIGISFDWSREINTTDPGYYKWTQWIFIQMFKKGLAYKTKTLINWCPKDQVTLANEEVVDGACERCGTPVEKREKVQWMLAITKYAQRLYGDLDTVDYINPAKVGQRNWIGPSDGAELEFEIKASDKKVKVFTTRPDTLFGATYLVLAPEHPLVPELSEHSANKKEIIDYVFAAKNKSDIERSAEGKEKTGVKLEGVSAVNPASKAEVPVYIADYVLGAYGTGAIMAVPAHDERDFAFATAFTIPVIEVITRGQEPLPYTGYGNLINSGKFDGLESNEAKKEITDFVGGKMLTTFKLRDWVFGRQRYWGEPIPMISCPTDGWVPVPDDQLPVLLPETDTFLPGSNGESPLAGMDAWVNTTCPTCSGPAKRETDVMPQWAGSSWYYLRFADPTNTAKFADKEKLDSWTPVDWYNGGMEHTTLHLLYSRFWHKFLYDIGQVPTSEPYLKRTSHGLILAEGGEKMSKSKGNTVSPDTLVTQFGADSLRLYEMFIGPFDQPVAWNSNSILGVRRFLENVWALAQTIKDDGRMEPATETLLHQTIEKVTKDIELLKMNTAVSALMIYTNHLKTLKEVPKSAFEPFLKLLMPFAPHMADTKAGQLSRGQCLMQARHKA
jgi:leucyl-tRNA synthetase